MYALNTCYFKNADDSNLQELEREIDSIYQFLNLERNTIEDYVIKYEQEKVKKRL